MLPKFQVKKNCFLSCFLIVATSAFAQQNSQGQPQAPRINEYEVEVIDGNDSRKNEASISGKGNPAQTQIFDEKSLQATLPVDSNDAVKSVAGAASPTSQGSANPALNLRGIQLNLYQNYRLNGGLSTTGIQSAPIENKERIEVMKGANAVQFGLATPSGIVNYVTKRAKDKDITSLTTSINSFGQYSETIDIGRKFGDEKEFGLRFVGQAAHLETGVRDANGEGGFGAIALDWQATKDLAFKLDYENIFKNVVEQAQIQVVKGSYNAAGVLTPAVKPSSVPNPGTLLSAPWAIYSPRTQNFTFRGDYKLTNDWKVLAEYGISESVRLNRYTDQISFSGTGLSPTTGKGKDGWSVIENQRYINRFYRTELQGQFNTGPVKHDVILGMSLSQRYQNVPNTSTVSGPDINIYAPDLPPTKVTPVASCSGTGAAYKCTYLPNTYSLPTQSSDSGPYISDTITVIDPVKVTVGGRFTRYNYSSSAINGFYTPAMPGINQSATSYNLFSPSLGIDYNIAKRTSLYASYMKSLEDGQAAPFGTNNQYQVLSPTQANQKEFGIKSAYFENFKSVLAYFSIDRAAYNTNATTNMFQQDGTATYSGWETTNTVNITKEFAVDFAGTVMNAVNHPVIDLYANNMTLPGIAKQSANAAINYYPKEISGLRLTAGTFMAAKKPVDYYQSAYIPGYATYNIGAGYRTIVSGKTVNYLLAVDNLTNLNYFSGVAQNATTYGVGLRRNIRGSIKIDF